MEQRIFCKEAEKYDEELLRKRQAVEANIIGCLWKDPLLYEEVKLESSDFLTHDGRFYFVLGKNLVLRGYTVLDEPTIITNNNEKVVEMFYDKGGIQSIGTITDIIDLKNFETYLDQLNCENILLKLNDFGYRVTDKISELRKLNSEELIAYFENEIGSIEIHGCGEVEEDDLSLDDEFIKSCVEGQENGTPFDYAGEDINGDLIRVLPRVCNEIQGYLHGTLNMIAGHSSTGKTSMYINIINSLIYNGEKVLIISNEQKAKPFKIGFLCWIITQRLKYWKINKKKLMSGQLEQEDLKYIKMATEIWNKEYAGNVKFIGIPDANMNIVKKKIRQAALKDGFTCFIYDTLKIEISEGKKDNFWLDMIMDSRVLHSLASRYNMIGLCSIQLASNSIGHLFLNESCLSTSKQVIEIMESALMIRNVFAEEMDERSKYYCKPFRRVKDEKGNWKEEKFEPQPGATYKMLFMTKCRNGENSNASGVAILLRFFGGNGIFQEACLCRPKNAVIGGR